MKVSWHEMPGVCGGMIRPVGYGVIAALRPVRVQKGSTSKPTSHTVPSGTGFSMERSQAFHAWLPSPSPSGTTSSKRDSETGGHALGIVVSAGEFTVIVEIGRYSIVP
jgi:hypothetical protein